MKHGQQCLIFMSVWALAALSLPAPLFGQSVGERVRATGKGDKIIGTIQMMNQSSFVLKTSGGNTTSRLVRIRYSNIIRLERSKERGNYWKHGARTGFLIGALPGAFIGLFVANFCLSGNCSPSPEASGMAVAGTFLLGVPSAVLGMGIGALLKREKWEPIPIPSTIGRFQISPKISVTSIGGDRYPMLGASVRF